MNSDNENVYLQQMQHECKLNQAFSDIFMQIKCFQTILIIHYENINSLTAC